MDGQAKSVVWSGVLFAKANYLYLNFHNSSNSSTEICQNTAKSSDNTKLTLKEDQDKLSENEVNLVDNPSPNISKKVGHIYDNY